MTAAEPVKEGTTTEAPFKSTTPTEAFCKNNVKLKTAENDAMLGAAA